MKNELSKFNNNVYTNNKEIKNILDVVWNCYVIYADKKNKADSLTEYQLTCLNL